MKNISLFSVVAVLLGVFASCEQEKTLYSGADYVKFADTLQYIAIQNNTDYHDIVIATTQAADHDRTFGVEVVEKQSNAIEGLHYTIENNSVTIKAGERTTAVRLKGNYDKIVDTDSIGVTLRLVNKEMLYTDSEHAHVIFRKVAPFNIDTFTGYVRIKSTYFSDNNIEERIVKSEKVDDNTCVVKNFVQNGYDLHLHFSSANPLEPAISLTEGEVIGTTTDLYGAFAGDGLVRITEAQSYTSMFNSIQKYVVLYPVFYIKDLGILSTYLFTFEWISDAEAEAGY